MGLITNLDSLCNGVVQNVDHSTRLINDVVNSGMLDSASIKEMENILRLFKAARSSVSDFQYSMTLEQRFEEFE